MNNVYENIKGQNNVLVGIFCKCKMPFFKNLPPLLSLLVYIREGIPPLLLCFISECDEKKFLL